MATLDEVWAEIEPAPARRLLVGAIGAFAARGYHASTTRDIASLAGMSPAGMYVHYRSKEELLFRISLIGHERCLSMLTRAGVRGGDAPPARLRAQIEDFAAWHASHHTTARVIQYEHESLSDAHKAEIVRLRRQMEALVRDTLGAGVASGAFDVPDIGGTALAMLSAGIDVARWYRDDHRRTPADIGALYGELAVRTVRRVTIEA
jgi:AcrR family transcriptional regulator